MHPETNERLARLMMHVFRLQTPDEARWLSRDDGGQWDSLRHMELIFAVEDAFGIQFTEADLAHIRTHAQLATRVEELRGERPAVAS